MSGIKPNDAARRPIRKRDSHTRARSASAVERENLKEHFIKHPEQMVGNLVRYMPLAKGSRREEELLGFVVGVRFEKDSRAKLIAYQKLYIIDENREDDPASATRIISLSHETKSWMPVPLSQWKGRKSMEGRRIVCHWEAEYSTPKNRALQEKLRANSLPYEAFIVRALGKGRHKILYTAEDSYYEADLLANEDWAFVDHTQVNYNDLPIVSWTTAGLDNVDE